MYGGMVLGIGNRIWGRVREKGLCDMRTGVKGKTSVRANGV